MTLDEIVSKTIAVEGGYSNNPNDSGGETIWGITVATARASGYTGPMKAMPRSEAVRIYKDLYLIKPRIADINTYSSRICEKVFDTGVNCGTIIAVKFLQTALNVLNRGGSDYHDQVVDGKIGSKTLAALETFLRLRKLEGEVVLLKILNTLQGSYYVDLAARREKDEAFIFGWFRNRIDIPGLERL